MEDVKKFWECYEPTLESMLLSPDAKYLAENEEKELLSYLPNYKGATVLELGAGIGRFTSTFAQVAEHVTAIDLMETFIEENQRINSQYENISYQCADVRTLDFPGECFDLVFSNWLLAYLSNIDVEVFISRILKWLKPSGHFFFRESCFHYGGTFSQKENPARYRTPLEYINMLSRSRFALISAKNVLTYLSYQGNPNQLCFLAQKQNEPASTILPKYDVTVAEKHQEYLGPFWRVTGGQEIIINTFKKLGLRQGQKILHLMSGTGEVPFLLAKHFNVVVHGVEESPSKMHFSIVGQGKQDLDVRQKIQFESTALSLLKVPSENYDLIICLDDLNNRKDTFHIISCFKDWLKPGGRVFITDYFLIDKICPLSENISKSSSKDGMLTLKEMQSALAANGLEIQEVKRENHIASLWLNKMKTQLQEANQHKDEALLHEILDKEQRISNGTLEWGQTIAMKK